MFNLLELPENVPGTEIGSINPVHIEFYKKNDDYYCHIKDACNPHHSLIWWDIKYYINEHYVYDLITIDGIQFVSIEQMSEKVWRIVENVVVLPGQDIVEDAIQNYAED